jgi:HK97 family phage portal protein
MKEVRNSFMASWPNGYGWNDPAAIPPPGLFNQQRAGVPVTTHTALQVDAVFTAMRVISNGIIKMGAPLAYTRGYDKYNEWYRQYLNPQPGICSNTFGDKFQFDGTARSVISLALFGECFWYILDFDDGGDPMGVEVLNPAFVEMGPVLGRDGKPTGAIEYKYGSGLDKIVLNTEQVIHIPFLAVPGGQRGLNSIEYAGVNYALALAAMEYGSRWFAQGASPSFLLSTEQKLGEPEIKRIAEKFLIEHSGLQAAHLPLVVDQGLRVEKLGGTPDEAEYIGTLEYARMTIASWFGIPAHLIGGTADKGNVWGKTVQQQGFQMVDYTFSGYTVRFEEAYTRLLTPGIEVHYDDTAIQRASSEDLAHELQWKRQGTIFSPDEIRVSTYRRPPAPDNRGDDIQTPLASNAADIGYSASTGDIEPPPDDTENA